MDRFKEQFTKKVNGRGRVYRISLPDSIPTDTPTIELYTPQLGERFDNIAYKFYGDSTLWYVIAQANNYVKGTLYPRPNEVIRIPRI